MTTRLSQTETAFICSYLSRWNAPLLIECCGEHGASALEVVMRMPEVRWLGVGGENWGAGWQQRLERRRRESGRCRVVRGELGEEIGRALSGALVCQLALVRVAGESRLKGLLPRMLGYIKQCWPVFLFSNGGGENADSDSALGENTKLLAKLGYERALELGNGSEVWRHREAPALERAREKALWSALPAEVGWLWGQAELDREAARAVCVGTDCAGCQRELLARCVEGSEEWRRSEERCELLLVDAACHATMPEKQVLGRVGECVAVWNLASSSQQEAWRNALEQHGFTHTWREVSGLLVMGRRQHPSDAAGRGQRLREEVRRRYSFRHAVLNVQQAALRALDVALLCEREQVATVYCPVGAPYEVVLALLESPAKPFICYAQTPLDSEVAALLATVGRGRAKVIESTLGEMWRVDWQRGGGVSAVYVPGRNPQEDYTLRTVLKDFVPRVGAEWIVLDERLVVPASRVVSMDGVEKLVIERFNVAQALNWKRLPLEGDRLLLAEDNVEVLQEASERGGEFWFYPCHASSLLVVRRGATVAEFSGVGEHSLSYSPLRAGFAEFAKSYADYKPEYENHFFKKRVEDSYLVAGCDYSRYFRYLVGQIRRASIPVALADAAVRLALGAGELPDDLLGELEADATSRTSSLSRRLAQQLREVEAHADGGAPKPEMEPGRVPTLTLFTTAKAFRGHFGVIQENALRSWCRLKPRPQIVLFGTDDGAAEIAARLGLIHVPELPCSESGVPMVSAMFERVREASQTDWYAAVNADIILLQAFADALPVVAHALATLQRRVFVLCARRKEINQETLIDFDNDAAVQELTQRVAQEGMERESHAMDLFLFPREMYLTMPPLYFGRNGWDTWCVQEARRLGVPVIDGTPVFQLVHQNHDYSHVKGGEMAAHGSSEARRNLECVQTSEGTLFRASALVLSENGLRRGRTVDSGWSLPAAIGRLELTCRALERGDLNGAIDFMNAAFRQCHAAHHDRALQAETARQLAACFSAILDLWHQLPEKPDFSQVTDVNLGQMIREMKAAGRAEAGSKQGVGGTSMDLGRLDQVLQQLKTMLGLQ